MELGIIDPGVPFPIDQELLVTDQDTIRVLVLTRDLVIRQA